MRFGFLPATDGMGILVHGGAWDIPFEETFSHVEGMRKALQKGRAQLENGASALETVVQAITELEDHPAFDAGIGSVYTKQGAVELDAGLMDGNTMAFGAVACTQRIANPIQVAHHLLVKSDGQARLLVAEGAEQYAADNGFRLVENAYFKTEREDKRFAELMAQSQFHTSQAFSGQQQAKIPSDTVGCVVRDADGHLAAGTSTGGAPFTLSGRVGDAPLVGCGFYANSFGAVSATGWGEAIATHVLCARVVDLLEAGNAPDVAAKTMLAKMYDGFAKQGNYEATGGLIVIDRFGNMGWAYSTPRMAKGGWMHNRSIWTDL